MSVIARILRMIVVFTVWPIAVLTARVCGDPPLRFAAALDWASGPKTVYIDRDRDDEDYGCCALDPDHDGPCQWRCSTCAGTGRCPECGDVIEDDIDWCDYCQNGGCPGGCHEGWITEDMSI